MRQSSFLKTDKDADRVQKILFYKTTELELELMDIWHE